METANTGSQLLNFFLGGGLVAAIAAAFKGIQALKAGSHSKEREAIQDLEKWRSDSDDAREWEAAQHQWWRDWAGRLAYVILTHLGQGAMPEKEPYPERPRRKENAK